MSAITTLFGTTLPAALTAHAADAKKLGGKFQFNITGEGNWNLDLSEATVTEGTAPADLTVTVSGENCLKLIANPKSAVTMVFLGQVKVDGNKMLAMKLEQVFAWTKD